MAQHDYDIANQSGANFRADLNNALDAIVSNNSGSSEPSTTFAYEWWIDTSANVLKLRNSANNAWITLPLSITADNSTSGGLTVNGNLATTGTVDINGQELILDADADTSITADTDDQIDFRVGAVDVMTLTNSHLVLKGTTPKITIGDGGAEDTALIFDGNAQDFYIGLDDTDDFLKIGTGSTIGTNTLVTIENGGNVGIGCDPVGTFQIKTQTNGNAAFQNSTSVSGGVKINCFNDAANASSPFEIDGSSLQFNIASTEKMRLDANGNLGLGTSSPSMKLNISHGDQDGLRFNCANTAETFIDFGDTDDNDIGRISYDHADNHMALRTNNTERMRIDSSGSMFVGATSTGGTAAAKIEANGGTDGRCMQTKVTGTGAANAITFNNGNGQVGRITTDGSATSFVGSSDYRMKENIVYDWNAMTKVKSLKPAQFNFKTNTDEMVEGFIAHEAQSVVPYAVVGEKDGVEMQGMDYGKLTAILTKAIQELEARVKTLEE
tara:strand:+ start:248 stop:1738 length:1491 start_codon:yes stop_codon:yes gene_type:complete